MRRATILVNGRARGVRRGFSAEAALRALQGHGIEATVRYPATRGAMAAEARLAAERGEDLVFAAGGDGSLRIVAGALVGSKTALAALPTGTANVWGREMGIPSDVERAIAIHAGGQTVAVDLGYMDDEPFLLMASAGWDADIVHRVGGRLKRILGEGAYVLAGMWALRGLRLREFAWRGGGEERQSRALILLASNTRLYGGRLRVANEASAHDGLLDVDLLAPSGIRQGVRLAWRLARGRPPDPDATSERFASIEIETAGIPVQVDGDAVGTTPCTVRVEPAAVLVSVPAGELPPALGGG